MTQNANPTGFYLNHVLKGHGSYITRLSWTSNGQQLITASLDATAKVWEASVGIEIARLTDHKGPIHDIASFPASRYAVTASSDKSLIVWDVDTGKLLRRLSGHSEIVCAVAITPDEKYVLSGSSDRYVKMWNLHKDESPITFYEGAHLNTVYSIVAMPNSTHFITGSTDKTIKIWSIKTRKCVHTLRGHTSSVWDLALHPTKPILASCSPDKTIRLWDLVRGAELRILEGHTGYVIGLSFSPDGTLLVSKSLDSTIRLWNCETWDPIALLHEEHPVLESARPEFNPKDSSVLATLNDDGKSARLWHLNYDEIFGSVPKSLSVSYTTAKIALVGESSVGKSALGFRIATGEFIKTDSTHGQQFWVVNELGVSRSDGTECEAVLWDFAGQPDYKIVHSLFLRDVDLALILFDATNQQDPLKGVEFWLKQLPRECKKILVASRIDRGALSLTRQEIEQFCLAESITGGYIETSAKEGRGIDTLLARIRSQIDWDKKVATGTTQTFKRVKEHILNIKETSKPEEVLMSWEQLSDSLRQRYKETYPDWDFSEAEMRTAVTHLQTHGLVAILRRSRGEEHILLTPDLLTKLASSIVLEARRNPYGLGAVEEERILKGDYEFPEISAFSKTQQYTLLDAALALFVRSAVCQREVTEDSRNLLVFPSLINQKRPSMESFPRINGQTYTVKGAVEGIYASLVVLLGYTNIFKRTNQWQNSAQYRMGENEICGFQLVDEKEGELELVLYFSKETPEYTRQMFTGLFERFLHDRDVDVSKYSPLVCMYCGREQSRTTVIQMLNEGEVTMFCVKCGQLLNLRPAVASEQYSIDEQQTIDQEQIVTELRTQFAELLVYIKRIVVEDEKKTPTCFISYAWGNSNQEDWVMQLAIDLWEAGIEVILDRWDARIGEDLNGFMSQLSSGDDSNFVLMIGTPLYFVKFQNKNEAMGSAVAAEVSLINDRLIRGAKSERDSVLPILLDGSPKESLPPLVRSKSYLDFRDGRKYFSNLYYLILRLYDIPNNHPGIIGLSPEVRSW